MPLMSSGYDQLLDATIRHLENLQAQGVRHVAVTAETLRALTSPVMRSSAPAAQGSLRPAAPPISAPKASVPRPTPIVPMPKPVTPVLSAAPAVSNIISADAGKAAAFAALRERVLVCVKCPNLASSRK